MFVLFRKITDRNQSQLLKPKSGNRDSQKFGSGKIESLAAESISGYPSQGLLQPHKCQIIKKNSNKREKQEKKEKTMSSRTFIESQSNSDFGHFC